MRVFKAAIKEVHRCVKVDPNMCSQVPKSGEVWCEGARLCMNPTSPNFNLRAAKRFLVFAAQFTPQYGDSFIEQMRLKMLIMGIDDAEVIKTVEKVHHTTLFMLAALRGLNGASALCLCRIV